MFSIPSNIVQVINYCTYMIYRALRPVSLELHYLLFSLPYRVEDLSRVVLVLLWFLEGQIPIYFFVRTNSLCIELCIVYYIILYDEQVALTEQNELFLSNFFWRMVKLAYKKYIRGAHLHGLFSCYISPELLAEHL